MIHDPSNKAILGGALSLTAGLVFGTAGFLRMDASKTLSRYVESSASTLVSWMGRRYTANNKNANQLLAASSSSSPLERLRRLNHNTSFSLSLAPPTNAVVPALVYSQRR
ncbi:hypothetical protein BCR43DRAFT_527042 [Syncephalastrum racemosum]|uniref:Uncharacterized protein n=1 Tax=Syncephalastrum racemosum TaxID=13706 RepID=A0A1X2H6B3_SYNRA|nr:hypothetical protein BCR43DRAFT_527042 [Syncephalastrum racemosum]